MTVKNLCPVLEKVRLAEREEKHSIPNFKSKTTLVKLFQSIIHVNTLCL